VSDARLRAGVDGVPVPVFETSAFTTPPPLDRATVAIVTTAALHTAHQQGWRPQEQSFRVLDADDRDLRLGHWSPNFDRVGLTADLDVVYPLDRLTEMAADGMIGAVAPRHLSFLGAQTDTMTTIRLDTGPAAARLLKQDGADVVLLTPV